ncbi:hypothetical protein OIU34_24175 [Pararhizobium sp. BT-229]|uniref:hypothetical protein n=1 Tax=Pararhizobium sp. BT-229 TaxID=2986923 RepID=UPI0021F6FC8F|nr:hypothetical protein [Pararhizobium sp. BT-229]MCV9964997.1 hypothetical protein [Pararhizobium sp. BT-229]
METLTLKMDLPQILVNSWRTLSGGLLALTLVYVLAPGLLDIELPLPTTTQIVTAGCVYAVWTFVSSFIAAGLGHLVGRKAA